MLKYTIVIFVYNLENHIEQCINSVLNSTIEKQYSIYIMANGCDDATENIVHSKFLTTKKSK